MEFSIIGFEFFSTCDFQHVISETLQNVLSWSIHKMSLVFFDVVYPKLYTSHRIGKVLKKDLFSPKIVKAAENVMLS